MNKELYVIQNGKPQKVIIRNYGTLDFDGLIQVQKQSFPPPFPEELWWNEEQLASHLHYFPQGALCAEVDGVIVGSMTAVIIDEQKYVHHHEWSMVTDNGYIRNHDHNGDVLYVVDICVVPQFRKSGIGKWLMQSMYETVVHLKLKSLQGGGRMPGYKAQSHRLSAEQYVDKVIAGDLSDPVISFLLRSGRVPIRIAPHYLEDEQSCDYAVIMEWKNPFI